MDVLVGTRRHEQILLYVRKFLLSQPYYLVAAIAIRQG